MIVFTNGCFDILHPGHVDLLRRARELGDKLVVGINSDESVRKIKGPGRPLQDQDSRRAVLLGLNSVDDVIIFDELTPEMLIRTLRPDVLVKGGDWKRDEIIGADFVESYGGSVHSLALVDGHSSSSIVERIDTERSSDRPAQSNSIARASLDEHLRVFSSLVA
ncbi:MAG: D-glycero-beta-D-manno-heptose 1-phosphate adenylyltransferase, partial [Pyrinomonadaceae bacterium]